MDIVLNYLFENRDEEYAKFQSNLTPALEPDDFIGVRTPILRKYAKTVIKEDYCDDFLNELPHKYFDENQLHGFIISEIKDFDQCISRLQEFLPYINNWATCDQTAPKIFKKNKDRLIPYIEKWIESNDTYIVRFGIGMLMSHFLDDDFDVRYLDLVSSIRSEEYYVNMEIAWYMATALAKQWDSTIKYIENNKLDKWTHNKTIQKARESYRITNEQKEYLKSLKQK